MTAKMSFKICRNGLGLCVGNTAVKNLLKLLGMRDNPVSKLVLLPKLLCGTT